MRDSFLVNGFAFKNTFSYAGFEQQPKTFLNPKILLLNIELELKSGKRKCQDKVDPLRYRSIVDAQWNIHKLDKCVKSGAKIILSRLAIGDLATQVLGSCEVYEEKHVGNERFNIFSGCPSGLTATIVLRGGADQLSGVYMIVRRAMKNSTVVSGGGAIDLIKVGSRVFVFAPRGEVKRSMEPIIALAYIYDGLHYGVSDFEFALCSMMLVGAISLAFLLYAPSVFGLAGVWAGLTLFMGMRAISGPI
ncbi:T-complex protein 1 subunit eta, partial [Tanacetum coccineum]